MTDRTIIVGAGLAGLSAAYELVQAGHNIQVFEAQQRLGGRVYTVQMESGQYGDLGAEFVDDNHTAVMAYATQFDLKLDPACQFPDDLYWFSDGILRNWNDFTTEQENALDNFYTQLSTAIEQQSDPLQTLEQWMESHQITPFVRRLARVQSRGLYAVDADSIGVGFFAQYGSTGSSNLRMRGGSSQLVNALAGQVKERIGLGTPVRRIQQKDNTVTVSVETANGLEEVVADNVIVAIPWSVLRHIPLDFPISEAHKAAIFELPYGSLVKTLVQYPDRFWTQANFGIQLLESDYQAIWEPTFTQVGKQKILCCYSGGRPSLTLGERAIDTAKQTVHTLYPHAPEAIACRSYDWNTDLWAKGGYCYFAPGQLDRFNPHLTLPAGRVFFAGEHTAPVEYRGYMEGAVRSGIRAAQQILNMGARNEE
ncbi:flavin monoamine oxidase family protein [Chroococcidiopsis sp.]|uniref:flavin monoamine oxidase family protein n=1 Tax=Chroococcidiopsis sp. TaxID=3088168 RepID=UPI003F3746EB